MCGIIAYTGGQAAAPLLMQGLKRLEYRGYDSSGISTITRGKLRTIKMPGSHPLLQPIILAVPLQIFAYYSALMLNRNADQPRNLAKSVTVE